MKTNKILLGGITGGVTLFFLGWLIYGIILMDYMMANSNQCANRPMEQMIWWAMILSNLATSFLLVLIFSRTNTKGFLAGAKMAAIIGLLISAGLDLSMYSMSTMFSNLIAVVVDVIAYAVMLSVTGGVIGWIVGMEKK